VLTRIGGLESYYTLEGRGEPIVLLHGWGASSQSLQPVAASLTETRRVLTVDLPGFGWSQPPPEAWGSRQYADHVVALLDQVGIGRAAILGHSNGGRVAIQIAAAHPARVSQLLLVASAGVRPRRGIRYYARIGTTKLLRAIAAVPGLRSIGQRLLARWADRVGSRDYRAAGRMRPTLVRLVNEDLTPMFSRVQAPTLVLWGDQDREVGRSAVELMAARIPRARLEVLAGAGHFPFLDAPEAFGRAVGAFLGGGRP